MHPNNGTVAKGKRTAISLLLFVVALALLGLAWQNYPKISSSLKSRPDLKNFSGQNAAQKKPISTTSPAAKKRVESNGSGVSHAALSQKTASIATPSQGQIVKQTETKSGEPDAPQRPSEPSGQVTEKQLTADAEVVARTSVTGEKAIAKEKATKEKAVALEASIEHPINTKKVCRASESALLGS